MSGSFGAKLSKFSNCSTIVPFFLQGVGFIHFWHPEVPKNKTLRAQKNMHLNYQLNLCIASWTGIGKELQKKGSKNSIKTWWYPCRFTSQKNHHHCWMKDVFLIHLHSLISIRIMRYYFYLHNFLLQSHFDCRRLLLFSFTLLVWSGWCTER